MFVDVFSMVTKKLFTITVVVEERKNKKEHLVVATAESSQYPEKLHVAYNMPKSNPRKKADWTSNPPSLKILTKYCVRTVVEEILKEMEKYEDKLKEPEKVTFT